MSRLTLLHRDLSRRIESLKQIVEASQSPSGSGATMCCSGARHPRARAGAGDMHSIDLNPNTNQLIIRCVRLAPPKTPPTNSTTPPAPVQRGESLDEGFESDVDTISLVSTESAISLVTKSHHPSHQETDSANGSASSDSDDSDGKNTQQDGGQGQGQGQKEEIITEHFNLVNCVCYTDSAHPSVLILVVATQNHEADEETLIFQFKNPKELEAFHENFSTVKAVAAQAHAQKTHCAPFNLLQRTDSDGMTHIRISRQEEYQHDEDEFTSIISLPNISMPVQQDLLKSTPRFEKFATMGKPPRKRMLKKSKSIEDLLDTEKPLRKVWNSAENLLVLQDVKPKAPPRKGRKKGPAPLPPGIPEGHIAQGQGHLLQSHSHSRNLSRSFTSLHHLDDRDTPSVGNVFQGQFVRVQVDHAARTYRNFPLLNFRPKTGPELFRYESLEAWKATSNSGSKTPPKVKAFDAFKFSDPKNLTGYAAHRPQSKVAEKEKPKQDKADKPRGFSALKLYISAKFEKHPPIQTSQAHAHGPGSLHFTNRLFGMSSKLREFSSLQSGYNPNRNYTDHNHNQNHSQNHHQHLKIQNGANPYAHPQINASTVTSGNDGRFLGLGRLGRLSRSGSLGNLTLLAQGDKSQSSTLKSVIKKRSKDEDEGKRFGRHGKKVTFSAYNTVQVV